MSVEGLLLTLVAPMEEHLATLDGDTGSAETAAAALGRVRAGVEAVSGNHRGAATALLEGWWGDRAGAYTDRLGTLDGALRGLATTAGTAEQVAVEAVAMISQARGRIEGLIDEFLGAAAPLVRAALVAQQTGAQSAVPDATAQLQALASGFVADSAAELERLRGALADLAGRLAPPDVALDGLGAPLGGDTSPVATAPAGAAPAAPPVVAGDGSASPGGNSGSGSPGGAYTGGGGGGDTATAPRLPVAIPLQPGYGVLVNLPDGSTVSAPNETAAEAVRSALDNLGTPYVWGGTTPGSALDCSGLTMTAYEEAGLDLPRHSAAQAVGAAVPSADQLLPGDLVVWDGHVAMYIGNGQIVEAGDPVQVGELRATNSGMPFLGFFRPTG